MAFFCWLAAEKWMLSRLWERRSERASERVLVLGEYRSFRAGCMSSTLLSSSRNKERLKFFHELAAIEPHMRATASSLSVPSSPPSQYITFTATTCRSIKLLIKIKSKHFCPHVSVSQSDSARDQFPSLIRSSVKSTDTRRWDEMRWRGGRKE